MTPSSLREGIGRFFAVDDPWERPGALDRSDAVVGLVTLVSSGVTFELSRSAGVLEDVRQPVGVQWLALVLGRRRGHGPDADRPGTTPVSPVAALPCCNPQPAAPPVTCRYQLPDAKRRRISACPACSASCPAASVARISSWRPTASVRAT